MIPNRMDRPIADVVEEDLIVVIEKLWVSVRIR